MVGRNKAAVAAAPAAGTISINNINNTTTSFLKWKPVRRR
jgi:hypothetical protein